MRKMQQLVVTIALAVAAAISCSGCLALMVPGVAYSGYKYEHDKNQTAANTTSSTPNSKPASSTQSQKIPDSDIE
jgi:hypothetical protein